MTDANSLCELLDNANRRDEDKVPAVSATRRPHWSDFLLGAIAIALLLALSMQVSPAFSRPQPAPIVLKWLSE